MNDSAMVYGGGQRRVVAVVVKRVVLLLAAIGVLVCVGTASASPGDAFRPAGITAADTAVDAATALIEQRPTRVDGADVDELVVAGKARGVGGTTIVRFDQELHGVPVLGGEVVVTVDARRRVLAADGEVLEGASIAFGPSISATEAQQLARAALGKSTGVSLDFTEPALIIYDAGIVGGPGPLEPVLTWDFEVTNGADLHRRVFVDATTGYIVQTMDLIRTAKVRYVCDADFSNAALPCVAPFVRSEGDPASLIDDVNDAYDFAGITYDFFAALGRDSIDDAGMPLISTVRYCEGGTCPFNNAFWDGSQMTYGPTYAAADDVVAHELTHGVTEFTANLLYWYQSGAINEAMSDIMGEFVDLANPGVGDREDTAENRWLMGEDLPGRGAIRNMKNPPDFTDPDRVGSENYWTDISDNGGVHINSGVVNKTAFLIADGGTFNGQTVTGIGLTKSAWLWYNTLLTLRFASSFDDLANALDASCSMLTTLGTAGFTSADCGEVERAALATELRDVPPNVTVPEYCSAGAPEDVFNDGFDTGPATNWTIDSSTVDTADLWYGSSEASPDGANMHWTSALSTNARGVASNVLSDSTMTMTTGVEVPTGAFLSFSHWYEFEANDSGGNFDGGVIEYSTNGGTTWTDITGLTTINGYTGRIDARFDNPLGGQTGYVNASNGPVVTRIDLSTLDGQTVKFRFRIGTDGGGGGYGWYIDSARIYACSIGASAITNISPAMGAVGGGTTITLTGANLGSATAVMIGGIPATSVNVVNATTVTAVTPARASSLVDVAVTTSTGTVTSSAAFRYGLAEPTIAGVSPSSGPLAGGTTITITGAELAGTTNVTVGGVPATGVTVVNATTVTAVTPAHAAGAVAVAVATPDGAVAAAGAFTYSDPAVPAAPVNPAIAAPTTTAPVTTAKTPPATGTWTTNTRSDVVRALFVYQRGTTYTIRAVRGSMTRRGICRRVGATVNCSINAPTGRWRVTVTPRVNGKTGRAIVRVVRT